MRVLIMVLLLNAGAASAETVFSLGYDISVERGTDRTRPPEGETSRVRARAHMKDGGRVRLIDDETITLEMRLERSSGASVLLSFVLSDSGSSDELMRSQVEAAVPGITEFEMTHEDLGISGAVGIGTPEQ